MSHALDPYIDQLIPTTKLSCSEADPYTGDTHGWSLRSCGKEVKLSFCTVTHTYVYVQPLQERYEQAAYPRH